MAIGAGIDLIKDNSVVIDYTSLDAPAVEADLRTYAQTQFHDRWTNFNDSEFAVVFLKILAYLTDLITYQFNVTIGETQPATARRRKNFINIAKGYDYELPGPVASSVDMKVISNVAQIPYPLDAESFKVGAANGSVFMPSADVLITASPQTVPFTNGDLQDQELLGTSDGSPAQEYELAQAPVIWSAGAPVLTVTVAGVPWSRERARVNAQSTSEVYFVETDEADTTRIVFGDGINGKIPSFGAEIRATYKVGGGTASNINPRTISTILTPVPGVLSVQNPARATGGKPRQSLREAKSALPASIKTNDRAVTADDYADILFAPDAPSGTAKAGAAAGFTNVVFVWAVPAGGPPLSNTLRNEIAAYLDIKKVVGKQPIVLDGVPINIRMTLGVYVKPNFREDDVVAKVRSLFVTEDPAQTVQQGVYDFNNVGMGARDDENEPQITQNRIHTLARSLLEFGLQRIVIEELRTTPVTKQPRQRVNAGNGGISNVVYLTPLLVPRREFRILWTSATDFEVYRRIVGASTLITDDSLVDNRLNLDNAPDFTLPLPAGSQLNPNRDQTLAFDIDTAATVGNTIVKDVLVAGSLFGNAAPGDNYYLEVFDGVGSVGAPTNATVTYQAAAGDLEFNVSSGTTAFTSGDEILFDVFPLVGDIILREDEYPNFQRDANGIAIDLLTPVRDAE